MVKHAETPWYERNMFWGPLSLGLGIVLAVIAAMKTDLRWLLCFAWLFVSVGTWGAAKHKRFVWPITVIASITFGIGLAILAHWLRPAATVTSSVRSKPAGAASTPPDGTKSELTQEHTIHTAPPKPRHSAANGQVAQTGNGNQQTTNQGTITQSNSGGCNQQVVGGNGNTNICAPLPRALTGVQGTKLASAIAAIPEGIQVKVGSADSGESRDYAEQIRSAFGIQREVGTLFGWHPKGIFVGVNSNSDAAAIPAQKLASAMKQAGLNIVDIEEDPTHDHPGEIEVIVGEQ